MSNSTTEKLFSELLVLFKAINYGSVNLELEIVRQEPRIITFYGEQTHLYNRSKQDEHTNVRCFEDIVNRIQHSVVNNDRSDIAFTVEVDKGKVRKLKWQTKTKKPVKVDNTE